MGNKRSRQMHSSRHGRARPVHPLPDQILQGIQQRAEAIGPLQAAAEMAAMTSVMFEGYTEKGRLRANPKVDYRHFVTRADRLLPGGGSPDAERLRRSIWDRLLQLVARVGPFVAMAEMAIQCGLMITVCRELGCLKPGPTVQPWDFAKRADGASLL